MRQELLVHRGRLGSSPVFGEIRVAHLFIFLCCVYCFVFVALDLANHVEYDPGIFLYYIGFY
jgi:hypothetical protein